MLSCFSLINSYFDQWHVRKQGLKTTHSSIVEQNQNNCRRKNCRTSHLLRFPIVTSSSFKNSLQLNTYSMYQKIVLIQYYITGCCITMQTISLFSKSGALTKMTSHLKNRCLFSTFQNREFLVKSSSYSSLRRSF